MDIAKMVGSFPLLCHEVRQRMQRFPFQSLTLGLVGVVSCRSITQPTFNTVPCLDRSGVLVTLVGNQATYDARSLVDNSRIDARRASWFDQGYTPVAFGGKAVCWSGGSIEGTFPDTTPYATIHDTYGMLVYGPNAVVENIRIHNYGDGISFNAAATANWFVRGVHLSFIRDDCIENDFLNSGLIEDSFMDGCNDAYSARPYGGFTKDGSRNLVTIRNTLMRLQPMPTVFAGPAPGHAPFFKLDRTGLSPRMALYDNVFRVDQLPSYGSPASGMYLIPPPDKLAGCANNVIVWLAPDSFPEPLPGCYTLTRDSAVWNEAAAHWMSVHEPTPP